MKHKQEVLNRFRSYSSIFSSTYFGRLVYDNDYSFLDSKIRRYDSSLVGQQIKTYYDYIKYVYGELARNYQNEYIYKNTLVNDLVLGSYGIADTALINEFRIGNSIADIALFNGTSKVFEIKTILDSTRRLTGQLSDYRKVFRESYVITHESLADKYLKEDKSVGVIEIFELSGSLQLREVRSAVPNSFICPDTIIHSVRTSEYLAIVRNYFGEIPQMNSFNMFNICKELIRQIPQDELKSLFISQMKKRKTNTKDIPAFSKELRQLGLSMKIDLKTHEHLFAKLNKPIQTDLCITHI